jgi:hypothetical protein
LDFMPSVSWKYIGAIQWPGRQHDWVKRAGHETIGVPGAVVGRSKDGSQLALAVSSRNAGLANLILFLPKCASRLEIRDALIIFTCWVHKHPWDLVSYLTTLGFISKLLKERKKWYLLGKINMGQDGIKENNIFKYSYPWVIAWNWM